MMLILRRGCVLVSFRTAALCAAMCFACWLCCAQTTDLHHMPLADLQARANAGDAAAQNELGDRYDAGKDGLTKDFAQSFAWYRKSAEQGYVAGEFNLGYAYAEGRGTTADAAQSFFWYQKSAQQGQRNAMNNLAYAYQHGKGTAVDIPQAVTWYAKAAEQGNAVAANSLASMYEQGKEVPKDVTESTKWYKVSADLGNKEGEFNYGWALANGVGVAKDPIQGAAMYEKAALQGHAIAQGNLGYAYEHGAGVPPDNNKALFWYRKAAAQGVDSAKKEVAKLEALSAPVQSSNADTSSLEAEAFASMKTNELEAEQRRRLREQQAEADAAAQAAQRAADAAAAPPPESTAVSVMNAINQGLSNLSDTLAQQNAAQSAQNSARMQQAQAQVAANDARRAQQAEAAREAAAKQEAAREAAAKLAATREAAARQAQAAANNNAVALNSANAAPPVSAPHSQNSATSTPIAGAGTSMAAQFAGVPGVTKNCSESAGVAQCTYSKNGKWIGTEAVCPSTGLFIGGGFRKGDISETFEYPCVPGTPASQIDKTGGTKSGPSSGASSCREVTQNVGRQVTTLPDGAFSCPGHSSATLTNNTTDTVTCHWAWLVGGSYKGGGTSSIAPGQTIGGAMSGMDSCNTTGMRYVCFDGKDPHNSSGVSCLGNLSF